MVIAGAVAVARMPRQTPEGHAKPRYQRTAEAPVPRLPAHEEAAPTPVVEEREFPAGPVVVERIEMLGTPRIETALSLAVERMTFTRVAAESFELRSPHLKLTVLSEQRMLQLLAEKSKELDIGGKAFDSLAEKVKASAAKEKKGQAEASHRALGDLVRGRTDLDGLPLVAMKDCVLSTDESKALAGVSRMKSRTRGDPRSPEARERHGSTATFRDGSMEILGLDTRGRRSAAETRGGSTASYEVIADHFVRPLRQVYEVQPENGRLALARILARAKSDRAARELVRLAVFDLSERVREEAVLQLATQDRGAVRAELLAAFRHPWAPAAINAAKAIDRLGDWRMIPALEKLLDQPDPCEPFEEKGTWYVRELVRVNHLKNCLLCHPAAGTTRPVVGGPVPLRDKEVPVVYYASRDKTIPLVDASTVYLRQDFSVLHQVKDAKPWPEVQRFDYFVRTRPLGADEIPKKGEKAQRETGTYPQREAVRALLDALGPKEPARMGS